MLNTPFNPDFEGDKLRRCRDMRKSWRAHGNSMEIPLNPNSQLDLFLKVATPGGRGETIADVPLQIPFINHTTDGDVIDLKFLWSTSPPLGIDGDLRGIRTPSVTAGTEMDWTLDESICFFGHSYNMKSHYAFSTTRAHIEERLLTQNISPSGANRLSYEDAEIKWFDELVFVWFTTTTSTDSYEWRNGVLRLTVELSVAEKAKRLKDVLDGNVKPDTPNNTRLDAWKTAGVLRRVECTFNMPLDSASKFRVTQSCITGKRAYSDKSESRI